MRSRSNATLTKKSAAECQTRFNSGQIQIYEMDMSTYLPKYYYYPKILMPTFILEEQQQHYFPILGIVAQLCASNIL